MGRRLTLALPSSAMADIRARNAACRRNAENVAIPRQHLAALLRDHSMAIAVLHRDTPDLSCSQEAFEALYDRLDRTERTSATATVRRADLDALLADHALLIKALGAERVTRTTEGGRA